MSVSVDGHCSSLMEEGGNLKLFTWYGRASSLFLVDVSHNQILSTSLTAPAVELSQSCLCSVQNKVEFLHKGWDAVWKQTKPPFMLI